MVFFLCLKFQIFGGYKMNGFVIKVKASELLPVDLKYKALADRCKNKKQIKFLKKALKEIQKSKRKR